MRDQFTVNLLRLIAGELMVSCGLQTSREMYGKGYFSLGAGEKAAVDRTVLNMIADNYNLMTEEFLNAQKASQNPVGFVPEQR
jgi:hypothetical protein